MQRLVGLCGNDESGRRTLAFGLLPRGWRILDVRPDIQNGLPPEVATQKALYEAQAIEGDVVVVGLSLQEQVVVIRQAGGITIFIDSARADQDGYPQTQLLARGVCHETVMNNSDILTGQAALIEMIEKFSLVG